MPGKSAAGKTRFVDGFIHKSTIGRGNFGVVSIVKCKADGVRYVMKKIAFTGKKQSDRDQSLAEVDLLRNVAHPNVVMYHSHGSDKRNLYIVMEFCEGGDLAQRIKAQVSAWGRFCVTDFTLRCCVCAACAGADYAVPPTPNGHKRPAFSAMYRVYTRVHRVTRRSRKTPCWRG